MTTFEVLRALGVIVVLGNSVARSEDPSSPAPPLRLARADTGKKAPVPSNTASRPNTASQAQQDPSVAAVQARLARRAARLPGVSCDPNGPVYEVLGQVEPGSESSPGRTDLLVHIGDAGRPDEVRIERSSGDEDIDAIVAFTVCDLFVRQPTQGGQVPGNGWAPLSIRLTASE